VQNIQEIAGMVVRLCPDARVAVAHGQMTGEKLEEIMTGFIDGEYDVLVSTAIVESGIDVSSANTIIINDAHHFGMSDLHQLRGRVGRNNKKAFCYLICPPLHTLTDEARKRLTAVEQFSDLGSGLQIAMRDLDIRGAGNLLGGEQSGFINDIGFETYQKILDEAIAELKQEHFADLYAEEQKKKDRFVDDTVLETDFEILIPDDYISQIAERIAVYRHLDEIENVESLKAIRAELVDRFGPIPASTEALLLAIQLRWKAARLGMEKLILKSGKMIGHFQSRADSHFYQSQEFTNIIEYVRRNHTHIKMYEKEGVLRISFNNVHSIEEALMLLQDLSGVPNKVA
jgi:transcription-repair coupling factor (superfamily II helicase)